MVLCALGRFGAFEFSELSSEDKSLSVNKDRKVLASQKLKAKMIRRWCDSFVYLHVTYFAILFKKKNVAQCFGYLFDTKTNHFRRFCCLQWFMDELCSVVIRMFYGNRLDTKSGAFSVIALSSFLNIGSTALQIFRSNSLTTAKFCNINLVITKLNQSHQEALTNSKHF